MNNLFFIFFFLNNIIFGACCMLHIHIRMSHLIKHLFKHTTTTTTAGYSKRLIHIHREIKYHLNNRRFSK